MKKAPQQIHWDDDTGEIKEISSQVDPSFEKSKIEFDSDPLDKPFKFLEYLKKKNLHYTYDDFNYSKENIINAIKYCQENGSDLNDLSPVEIFLATKEKIEDVKKRIHLHEKILQNRKDKLRANLDNITSLILPTTSIYIHSAPSINVVNNILRNGLYCNLGLNGTAVPLEKYNVEDSKANKKEKVIENNINTISKAHKNHPYGIVIEIPPLNEAQNKDYHEKRSKGIDIQPSNYFVKDLAEDIYVNLERKYISILPIKYIKGYIEYDTGKYHLAK